MNVVFEARFRPLRLGWCIRPGSVEDFTYSVKMNCMLAGGARNPIFDIDAPGIEELVNSFQIDFLVAAYDSPDILAFVRKFPHLAFPYGPLALKPQAGTDDFEDSAVHNLFFVQDDQVIRDSALTQKKVALVTWDKDDSLALLCSSLYGLFEKSTFGPNLTTTESKIRKGRPLPIRFNDYVTPFQLVGSTTESIERSPFRRRAVLYFRSPSLAVAIDYWNLRATGTQVIPVKTPAGRLANFAKSARRAGLGNPYHFQPPVVITATDHFVDTSAFKNHHVESLNDFVSQTDCIGYFCHSEFVRASSAESSSKTVLFAEIPRGPFTKSRNWTEYQNPGPVKVLMLSLSAEEDLDPSTGKTITCPQLALLNEYVSDHVRLRSDSPSVTRLNMDGVNVFVSVEERFIELTAFDQRELIRAALSTSGFQIGFSDGGARCRQMIRQMGGLDECAIFQRRPVRDLLDEFKSEKRLNESTIFQILFQEDSDSTIRISKDAKKDKKRLQSIEKNNVLSALTKKKVLKMGLRVVCPHCGIPDWTPAESISTKLKCESCDNHFDLYGHHQQWHYMRGGLFNPFNDQGGGIGVSLAVLLLMRCKPRWTKAIVQYGVTFTNLALGMKDVEVDFLMFQITPGAQSVIIGECKANAFPDIEDVWNLCKIAKELSRFQGLRVYIVLSGFGDITMDVLSLIAKKAAESPLISFIVLQTAELEEVDMKRLLGPRYSSVSPRLEFLELVTNQKLAMMLVIEALETFIKAKSSKPTG